MATTYRVCVCYLRKFRPASNDPPNGVKEVFRRYTGGGGVMGPEQLQRFLVEMQGEEKGVTGEMAGQIIDKFREHKFYKRGGGGLSVNAFFKYLFSDDNPPTLPSLVHHDMKAPLSHYFIYTSHNTYLTGNQLSSDCSDVPIIKALLRGVRAIELDMWPNPENDNVHIVHGGTFTTPVELMKCLTSIKEHAFSASLYPVIITLEDHLTPALQAKVAKMISETFGEMLFVPSSEFLEEFPSPEDLKMRIIISTKPPKEYLESMEPKSNVHGSEKGKDLIDEGGWGSEVRGSIAENRTESKEKDSMEEGACENELRDFTREIMIESKNRILSEYFQDDDDFDEEDHQKQQVVDHEYRRLIAIAARKRKGGFSKKILPDNNKTMRLSVNEQLLEKAAISHGTEIVRFTQRNLLRVYPKGTRITSSNYNPLVGWLHGAQMVAFNMQGYGKPLWMMHGMFRANGGCGYVKKPDILLKDGPNNQVFDPKAKLPVEKTLKVKIYMGDGWRFDFSNRHFDTYSPPDFFTRVGIAGVPADSVMKKTKIIEDDWTPFWEEEFYFPLTVPELALLRIEVHEYDMTEKDDFGGQTCLPISELRTGIRAVPLFDQKGEKLKSVKLLMEFQFF